MRVLVSGERSLICLSLARAFNKSSPVLLENLPLVKRFLLGRGELGQNPFVSSQRHPLVLMPKLILVAQWINVLIVPRLHSNVEQFASVVVLVDEVFEVGRVRERGAFTLNLDGSMGFVHFVDRLFTTRLQTAAPLVSKPSNFVSRLSAAQRPDEINIASNLTSS